MPGLRRGLGGGDFARFGFDVVTRDAVPAAIRASVEFTSACPSSATVMRWRNQGERFQDDFRHVDGFWYLCRAFV